MGGNIIFYLFTMCLYIGISIHTYLRMHIVALVWSSENNFLPCGFRGSKSDIQAWQQLHGPSKPSCWSRNNFK